MTDMHSDMPQDAHQRAPEERGTERTGVDVIQVLVFSPDGVPRLRTIENRPDALEALVGGPFIMFPTGITGTIGVSKAEGTPLGLLADRDTNGIGNSISGTFVVAGDAGDGITLWSISPLQLEQALERFCPTLPLAQFEQIMRSHILGPQWIVNWEPPEL